MTVDTSAAIGDHGTLRPPQATALASCARFLSPTSQSSIETWIARIAAANETPSASKRKRKRSLSLPARRNTRNTPKPMRKSSPTTSETAASPVVYAMYADQFPEPATPAQTLSSRDPSTPTTSSKRSFKTPSDAGWVSRRMQQHGMVSSERGALNRFPSFKATVERILKTDRSSAMKPSSVQRFMDRHAYIHKLNEDSILVNLIPLMIKDRYLRKLDPGSEEYKILKAERVAKETGPGREGCDDDDDDEDLLVSQEWFYDGIAFTVNNEFRRTLLPNGYENDPGFEPLLSKALSKGDGMKNPKPDYCYGLRMDKLDASQPPDLILSNDITYLAQVAPGIDHAFLIIEGKSNKGSVNDAENQARRGGATLVNAGRKLFALTGDTADIAAEGADVRTFVFSATMTPQCMDIYLHWAEVVHTPQAQAQTQAHVQTPKATHTLFHMTFLRGFHLRDEETLPQLRAILHNILEWGCSNRLAELQTLRSDLYNYQRAENVRLNKEAKVRAGRGNKRQRRDDTSDSVLSAR